MPSRSQLRLQYTMVVYHLLSKLAVHFQSHITIVGMNIDETAQGIVHIHIHIGYIM